MNTRPGPRLELVTFLLSQSLGAKAITAQILILANIDQYRKLDPEPEWKDYWQSVKTLFAASLQTRESDNLNTRSLSPPGSISHGNGKESKKRLGL